MHCLIKILFKGERERGGGEGRERKGGREGAREGEGERDLS